MIYQEYENCDLCNRHCHVNRTRKQTGFCNMTDDLVCARAALHYWEEPCISGTNGSGAVFFTGCSLRCIFCQNHEIAVTNTGKTITVDHLSEIFLSLQNQGANNINLVTPTHFVPSIIPALKDAKSHGLTIPIVYNTGTYDTIDTIKSLEGLIDIYLPDLKYYSSSVSHAFSHTDNYFSCASEAIKEMYRQVKEPVFSNGIMKRGMIVRHLALPGQSKDSKKILNYLYKTYGDHIYVSIMNQYTPCRTIPEFPHLNRRLTDREYNHLISFALDLGYTNAFIQEGVTAHASFIPEFNGEGV